MMSKTDPTDLLCQARRQRLSTQEQRALAALLRASPEARLADILLCGFERESPIQRGDDALSSRLVEQVLVRQLRPRTQRRRLFAFAAAAAILGAAGAAAALWVMPSSRPVDAARPATPRTVASLPRARGFASPPTATPVSPVTSTSAVVPSPTGEAPMHGKLEASRYRVASATLDASVPAETASELFARANLLRRHGQSEAAIALYRQLLGKFPATREAPPARLALAKALTQSQPGAAIEQYRLLSLDPGPLQAEGLWGVAELARRIGRTELEARSLTELLRQFPDSPYADVARSRLNDDHR